MSRFSVAMLAFMLITSILLLAPVFYYIYGTVFTGIEFNELQKQIIQCCAIVCVFVETIAFIIFIEMR